MRIIEDVVCMSICGKAITLGHHSRILSRLAVQMQCKLTMSCKLADLLISMHKVFGRLAVGMRAQLGCQA